MVAKEASIRSRVPSCYLKKRRKGKERTFERKGKVGREGESRKGGNQSLKEDDSVTRARTPH